MVLFKPRLTLPLGLVAVERLVSLLLLGASATSSIFFPSAFAPMLMVLLRPAPLMGLRLTLLLGLRHARVVSLAVLEFSPTAISSSVSPRLAILIKLSDLFRPPLPNTWAFCRLLASKRLRRTWPSSWVLNVVTCFLACSSSRVLRRRLPTDAVRRTRRFPGLRWLLLLRLLSIVLLPMLLLLPSRALLLLWLLGDGETGTLVGSALDSFVLLLLFFSRVFLLLLLLLRVDDEEEEELLGRGALVGSTLDSFVSTSPSSALARSAALVGVSEMHLLSLSLWRDELLRRVSAVLFLGEDFLRLLPLPVVTLLCSRGGLTVDDLFGLEEVRLGLRDRLSALLLEVRLGLGDVLILLLLEVLLGDLLLLLLLVLFGDLLLVLLPEALLLDLLPLLSLLRPRSRGDFDLEEERSFLDLVQVRRLGLGLSRMFSSAFDAVFLLALITVDCRDSESSKSG